MAKLGTENNPAVFRVQSEDRIEEIASICENNGWRFIIGIEPDKPEDISDLDRLLNPSLPTVAQKEPGRNEPCPCGSGKKYKKCCLVKQNQVPATASHVIKSDTPRCGLCGKTTNLVKTPCCDNWICDDEANYKLFSYSRDSCYRNHRRYTVCGHHWEGDHGGKWQDCEKCRKAVDAEMYAYYGTNEYNFEILPIPPKFVPQRCKTCGAIIKRGYEGYSCQGKDYWCEKCTNLKF